MSFADFWFYPMTALVIIFLAFIQLALRKRTQTANLISKVILLAYSLYIVTSYSYKYALVLISVIMVTYAFGLLVDMSEGKKRDAFATVGVVLLVCILGAFKYFNFFVGTVCSSIGLSWTDLNIILPIGISFYIFSAISYVLDVKWGRCQAEKNLINVALFLAFFPKLVCGPIVKAREFLPQLHEYRRIEWGKFCVGIQIFVFGFFKKMVLADHIAVFVDDVYYSPSAYNTGTVILAAISYSLQIYMDFSGYSDMAIGLLKILGYDVLPNFNMPYLAKNPSDFWSRWHISLSSWFRDYIYIPLGGSRKGEIRTYLNLVVVMLVSGLWHGAGWTFVIWGLLHGVLSCANKFFVVHFKRKEGGFLSVLVNFVFVTLLWVVFRCDNISNTLNYFKAMFTIHNGINQPYTWSLFAIVILVISSVMGIIQSKNMRNKIVIGYYPIQKLSTIKGLTIFFTVCGLAVIMGYFGETYFVYGAF